MSANRRYRKIYNNDGSARFYCPYHDDFVAELKKFVPEGDRKWHGDVGFWWITKDYTHVTEMICRKFFTEEKPPKRPPGAPPVYGDPDFYTYRAEQMRRDADEAFRNAKMPGGSHDDGPHYTPPFTYFDEAARPGDDQADAWARYAASWAQAEEAQKKRAQEAARAEGRRAADEEQARRQSSTRPPPGGFNDWFRQTQDDFNRYYQGGRPGAEERRRTGNDYSDPKPLDANERMTRPLAFQTLQVVSNACPEVLEAAYKALAKKFHPDRPGGNSDKMKRINEAYQMVKR